MPTIFKKIIDKLIYLSPANFYIDKVLSLIAFRIVNKRFPRKTMLLNDVLFRMKTNKKIIYNTLRQQISDKELVKNYIAKKIGSDYAVPTLMIFKSKNKVKQESLPNNCVIKSTHGNSQMLIRRNGKNVDINMIKSWPKKIIIKKQEKEIIDIYNQK